MAIKIIGAGGIVAEVTADKNLNVTLPVDAGQAGYARIIDSDGNALKTTENGYLRVSSANVQFFDQVDGAAVNTNLYNPVVSGMTITQTGGYWTLNASAVTTANAYAIMQSNKFIALYGTLPLIVDITAKVLNAPEANGTIEIGLGAVATNAAPTDGAFFRWTPSGSFIAVLNNNGVETSSVPLIGVFKDDTGETVTLPPSVVSNHLYTIEIVEDLVMFSVDDAVVATVDVPTGQAYPFNAGHQQVIARVVNGTTPSLAPQLSVGQISVIQEDMNQNKSWDETLTSIGRGAYQSPITPFAQTSNHVNSTSPTSATLSNTAASYTTLGGRWQFAALAGAAIDFALFAYQVPVGYQLVIRGITISSVSTGAVNSITVPTVLDWAIGVNASAVSLATADGTGTWAARRIPLSMQSFATSSLIGAQTNDIVRRFDAPIVVDSGRFLHIILQVPVGAATASQIIRGDVSIGGFFE